MQENLIYETEKLLKKICKKLYKDNFFGFNGSLNYSVTVKLFTIDEITGNDEIDLIERLLSPNAEVGEIEEGNLPELFGNVTECFEYDGDEGSYPNKKYLLSSGFRTDLALLLEKFNALFSDNLGVFKFWLKEGHPFYPVYWDYAFLIKKAEINFVLIGSSSD